jgi:DNA-binding beta-propeller fold protein YncE
VANDSAGESPPTDDDALSYLMGICGWKRLSSHAAVCKSWRDAARAKLQEWAVLEHERVTGGARGFGPGSLSRASAVLDIDERGLVVVDKGKLQILHSSASREAETGPGAGAGAGAGAEAGAGAGPYGTWRVIDKLIGGSGSPRSFTYADELLSRRSGSVPLSGWCLLCDCLATDDGGETVILGLSVQGHVVSSLGFGDRVMYGPRSGQVVRVRLADGALIHASATPHTHAARLGLPSGLATCMGRLFVVDAEKNCVFVLDAGTLKPPSDLLNAAEATFGERHSHLRRGRNLFRPHGIAVSPSQELYVCDTANHRVCVFTLRGELVRCFGTQGRLPGEFTEPLDVAVSAWRVYVAEGRRVQVLSLAGEPLQVLRPPGLNLLRGLALSAEGAQRQRRLAVGAGQGGVHLLKVGTAALAPS